MSLNLRQKKIFSLLVSEGSRFTVRPPEKSSWHSPVFSCTPTAVTGQRWQPLLHCQGWPSFSGPSWTPWRDLSRQRGQESEKQWCSVVSRHKMGRSAKISVEQKKSSEKKFSVQQTVRWSSYVEEGIGWKSAAGEAAAGRTPEYSSCLSSSRLWLCFKTCLTGFKTLFLTLFKKRKGQKKQKNSPPYFIFFFSHDQRIRS